MPECKFCGETIGSEDLFCKKCGYDPKTDRITPNFVPGADNVGKTATKGSLVISRRGVSPGVKKFAFISLIVIIFSLFYKNHFNISNVFAEVKHTITMISQGKFKIWEDKSDKEIQWIDVRTFDDHQSKSY